MNETVERYLRAFGGPGPYLNFASFGPPSRDVAEADTAIWQRAVAGADPLTLHAQDQRAIAAVSRLSGFPEASIVLSPSTSAGLFQLAFSMPGGEVLVSSGEFPANLYPWWRAEQAGLLRTRVMPADGLAPVTPERLARELTPRTTAVSVSAVDFRTGFRADLPGIREAIGDRLLVVDAIQGFGVVDQDWTVADAIVAGGQKWLRAGWGTGFVALSDRAIPLMRGLLSGWTGARDPGDYDGIEHERRGDAGALSMTNGSPFASAALATALELLEGPGVPAIAARVSERAAHLDAALRSHDIEVASPADPARRAGIVVARWDDGSAPVRHERLRDAGIVTTLHSPDRIRFSVHATTPLSALDRAVSILGELP